MGGKIEFQSLKMWLQVRGVFFHPVFSPRLDHSPNLKPQVLQNVLWQVRFMLFFPPSTSQFKTESTFLLKTKSIKIILDASEANISG